MEGSLADLVDRARSGDRAAADEIAGRYEDDVRRAIRPRLGKRLRARIDTDDVLQSTMVAAIAGLAGFEVRTEREFVQWLARIAERQIRMAARYHGAEKRDLGREQVLPAASQLLGEITSPSQGASRGERTKGIREAVSELPDPDRSVIDLHTFQGLTFVEIAERLGLTDKYAALRIHKRALKKLGDVLEGHR